MAAASTTSAASPQLEAVLKRIDQISTLPQVAIEVMQLAQNPETSVSQLKSAVESDPALSARVLRCVNSAAYGLATTITDLQQAISFLGFSQVRNLAITASVSECFTVDESIATYTRQGLWRHMVAVALCARLVARRCKISRFEEAFLAGLLHDIGLILEDQHEHDKFSDVCKALKEGVQLSEVEREILGYDHTQLGASVAEIWKFPPAVQDTIRYHHDSGRCKGPEADLVQCVEVANLICTLKGYSSVGMKLVRLPKSGMEGLGMGKEDIKVLAADLDQEFAQHEGLFNSGKANG